MCLITKHINLIIIILEDRCFQCALDTNENTLEPLISFEKRTTTMKTCYYLLS